MAGAFLSTTVVGILALAAIPLAPAHIPDQQVVQLGVAYPAQDGTPTGDPVGAASSVIRTSDEPSALDDTLTIDEGQAGTVGSDCDPVKNTLSNGNPETTDGALSVKVDGLGAFGTASGPGGNAFFNPPGSALAAGTVFSSSVYLSSLGKFLIDCDDNLESDEISRSGSSLVTRTTLGSIRVDLSQQLGPITGNSSTLTQTYTLTNRGEAAIPLTLARHIDGDLRFDDSVQDGAAASSAGKVLFEFDSSDDPATPSTFVGISGGLGANETPDSWTIQPFNYRDAILKAGGIPTSDNGAVHNDLDGDRIVDTPFDVTLSQQWNVGLLPPGAAVTFVTVTRFGQQAPNQAPNAADDSIATNEDTAGSAEVLANDGDPDGDPVSFASSTNGANGTVSCGGGVCTYTPNPDFNGTDSFAYTITDGRGADDSGTVYVTVAPVNDAPVLDNAGEPSLTSIVEDTADPAGNTVAAILATGAAGDPVSDVDVGALEGISVTGTESANGSWQYSLNGGEPWSPVGTSDVEARLLSPTASLRFVPNANFTGSATVEFRAWDQTSGVNGGVGNTTANGGTSAFSTAKETASITVTSANDPPVSTGDAYSVSEDATLIVPAPGVLANDSDSDGDPLTVVLGTDVSNGSLTLNSNGSFTYMPSPNFNGADSFTYRANDGEADSHLAAVTITVDPVDEARQTLTVTRIGNARITSAPAGIDCGSVCSADFELGTVVMLTATPDPGWTFSGWAGACGGSATCVLTVDAGKAVTASFAQAPPTPGQDVNAAPVAGTVLVKPPGATQFVPLSAPSLVPVGTQIDTTRGRVELTAARTGGITDTSQFYDGAFELGQQTPRAIAELRLVGGDFSVCSQPSFAAAEKNKRPVRRVWGSGKGKFRTRGRYSSATVRGTIWKTEDRCDGTLTQVREGSVTVRDFGRRRDIVVGARRSYLAEPLPRGVAAARCTIIGTSRRDVLRGTKRRDVICGLGGNDLLMGLGGNDKILGGPGNDRLIGGRGNDVLEGGDGNDWIDGGAGADILRGGRGVDFLVSQKGTSDPDRVRGGPGKDRCRTNAVVRVCP